MRYVLIVAAVLAVGGGLARMPGKYVFPQGGGSPGPVTFNHKTHVIEDEPNCVICHPTTFSALNPGKARGVEVITHEAMDRGLACGACHGKDAFKFTGNCDNCHSK